MSTKTMLGRYPWMSELVDATPRGQLPDYQPTIGDRVMVLNWLVGRLARVGLAIVILALLLAFLLALARG